MSIADPAPFTDEPHAPQSPETTDDRFVPKPVTPQEQADFNYWTKSFKYLLNIGLTEAEKQEYQEFADRKFYFAKKERCEKWRNQALKTCAETSLLIY
ncbi:Mitochondrial inner membrane protease ATP23 [Neolecta irregularis DAH-3]|uniref:Mitochondrial inner membrane protease ATP23 n=1 Tax=Neolecta irregularis (strain DAH-3) TaxID=1198029 RepID=A0A1U7LKS2_NEOID|nr:Mitochondrial inner membrane protease ATP23 [Neolecta irregularis DAH-3]|eukprot:OLL23255.1 Mitochondrial inner membrane protease ATP23 [Neolecta irregularis DAH-3]